MINKKILWALLAVFVSFDNIFSYFAITQHGMREWNAITRYFISINPSFYFISIPITLLFLYAIIKFSGWLDSRKVLKKKLEIKEFSERLMLTCFVIAWGIGVTSFNFLTFIRGFSNPRINYLIVLATGASLAVAYALYEGSKFKKKLQNRR